MSQKRIQKQLENILEKPGVYLFKDESGEVLYVGKASNLKSRVRSYFQDSYAPANPAKVHLVKEVADIETRETEGEITALVEESRLIKELQPRFNKLMRDDKQYFFVHITNNEFPRIYLTHQPAVAARRKSQIPNLKSQTNHNDTNYKTQTIGPFTEGRALKKTLKTLRKIFPYCTCKNTHKRKCLNAHLGLCPGYCCMEAKDTSNKTQDANKIQKIRKQDAKNRKEYLKNIRNIVGILKGERREVLKKLQDELQEASTRQEYEKAADIRDKIEALEKIFAHKKVLGAPTFAKSQTDNSAVSQELTEILGEKNLDLSRIEGYDISNTQGTEAVGSMVVFEQTKTGIKPTKQEYRKFKIRSKNSPDDPTMMHELISRRLRHPEWTIPDMILVDGGKAQLNAATTALNESSKEARQNKNNTTPAIVALAKQEEELYNKTITQAVPLKELSEELASLLKYVRDEAHRFANRYHGKRREMRYDD